MTNKFTSIFLVFLGITVGFLAVTHQPLTQALINQLEGPAESRIVSPVVSPMPTPDVSVEPGTIEIPALQLRTQVEWVGQDELGRMDVPTLDENVAWYQLGPQPGQLGNAVMAGHYDSRDGRPAVFYELNTLKPGDEIKVTGQNQPTLTFVVTRVATYEDATFPLEEVVGVTSGSHLNLITCAGRFDRQAQNYSDRLVVYSQLRSTL